MPFIPEFQPVLRRRTHFFIFPFPLFSRKSPPTRIFSFSCLSSIYPGFFSFQLSQPIRSDRDPESAAAIVFLRLVEFGFPRKEDSLVKVCFFLFTISVLYLSLPPPALPKKDLRRFRARLFPPPLFNWVLSPPLNSSSLFYSRRLLTFVVFYVTFSCFRPSVG